MYDGLLNDSLSVRLTLTNTGGSAEDCVRVHSHLRFIRHELLCELISAVNEPLVQYNPLFSK